MTRTSDSVPDARRRTRPLSPSSHSTADTSSHTAAAVSRWDGSATCTLPAPGEARVIASAARSAKRAPGPGDELDQEQRRQDPVTGHAVPAEDEVTGLLTPELQPVGLDGVAHEPVADRGLDDPDAAGGERLTQPEVAHDGHHYRPPGQQAPLRHVEGEQGEQLVPVDELAPVVDSEHPVGVTVERDPEGRSGGHHGLLRAARGASSRSRR